MEEIIYKNKLVGIVIRSNPQGTVPHTKINEPLQLITLKHKKGYCMRPRVHIPTKRVVYDTHKTIFVKRGRVKVDLFGKEGEKYVKFKSITIKSGNIFLLINGGAGFKLLEDSELIEHKNGPFTEKVKFLD